MCSKKTPRSLNQDELNKLSFNKIRIIDLKHSLRENRIKFKANLRKQDLYNLLKNNLYQDYISNIDIKNLIKIQSFIRKYQVKKNIYLKGKAFYNRKLCHNDMDPITFETIDEIPDNYFFSYKDNTNGLIYGFNILSIYEQVKKFKGFNPYTRNEYSKETIERVRKYGSLLKETNTQNQNLTLEQRTFDIFHEFQLITNMVTIDEKWFLDLDRDKLIKLYSGIEDIWNYRAELSPVAKLNYIPQNITVFNRIHEVINKKFSKTEMIKLLLDEFEKFITYPQGDNKNTAVIWILTALVELSPEAASALPNLVQFS